MALIIGAGVYQARRLPEGGIELRPSQELETPGQVQDSSWWRLLLGNAHLAIF